MTSQSAPFVDATRAKYPPPGVFPTTNVPYRSEMTRHVDLGVDATNLFVRWGRDRGVGTNRLCRCQPKKLAGRRYGPTNMLPLFAVFALRCFAAPA
jgi:hypothetical protein